MFRGLQSRQKVQMKALNTADRGAYNMNRCKSINDPETGMPEILFVSEEKGQKGTADNIGLLFETYLVSPNSFDM